MSLRVVVLVGKSGRGVSRALGLGDVCALSLTPPDPASEAPLRSALAAGAKRAVAAWDDTIAGTDYYGVAQVLAAAAVRIGFDILVCSDGRRGILGPAVADQLAVPHLSGVVSVSLIDGRVLADRPGGGELRTYAATPPLLVTLANAAEAGLPSEGPSSESVERMTLAELAIAPAELRFRRRFAPIAKSPSPAPLPRRFADPASLAARLVAEGLIAPAARRRLP